MSAFSEWFAEEQVRRREHPAIPGMRLTRLPEPRAAAKQTRARRQLRSTHMSLSPSPTPCKPPGVADTLRAARRLLTACQQRLLDLLPRDGASVPEPDLIRALWPASFIWRGSAAPADRSRRLRARLRDRSRSANRRLREGCSPVRVVRPERRRVALEISDNVDR